MRIVGTGEIRGGGGAVATSSGRLFNYGIREMRVLSVVCSAVGYTVGEWMGPAGSSDSGVLDWCILAVDGDQSVVELVDA